MYVDLIPPINYQACAWHRRFAFDDAKTTTTKRKSIKVKCHSAEMMSKREKFTFSEVKVKAIFTHVYAN